ncbi:MAG: pseudouridine synthase [Eubacterium sp.]
MKSRELRLKDEKPIDEEIRLNKFLSDAGFCSRREADRLIEQGKVIVNEKVAVMGQKVTSNDVVKVDNRIVVREEEQILIAFNKPVGVECTSDLMNPDNIIDYIGYSKRIYPIGRLDKNSQGLILLTNDGSLVNNILKASNYHEKEYIVTVDKPITKDFIQNMSSGVEIPTEGFIRRKQSDGEVKKQMTRPCKVTKIDKHTFNIILTQGLNRQIRRMCEELGYHVQKLKRIRVMNVELGILPIGTYRDVSNQERQKLLDSLKGKTEKK